VKYFDWSDDKNEYLKRERGISFEDAVLAILEGRLLTIIQQPNQLQYPGQRIYVVEIQDYAYVIPYIEDNDKIFLKTMYPSRKYTKLFIEKGDI